MKIPSNLLPAAVFSFFPSGQDNVNAKAENLSQKDLSLESPWLLAAMQIEQ
jgi:hypothetical protein